MMGCKKCGRQVEDCSCGFWDLADSHPSRDGNAEGKHE